MERKELTRKDLDAIAAGSSTVVPGFIIGQMMFLVYASDLEAAGLNPAILAERLGVTEEEIVIK